MTDYISREAALNFNLEIECEPEELQPMMEGMARVMDYIKKIPAADVVEVVHGKWIKSPECPEEYDICSVCGLNDKHRTRADCEHPAFESIPLFCKWCGAKMDGGDHNAAD